MSKYVKVGAVLKGEKNRFMVTGNSKAKNAKYNYNVEVIVTDADGKEMARSKNGVLNLFDPRKKDGADLDRIPDNLVAEVFIITE
jgi:hypothetical protein